MNIRLPLRQIAQTLILGLSISIAAVEENGLGGKYEHSRGIVVSATREVSVAPDRAVVRLGMTSQNSRASEAQSKVNQVMQKVVDGIEKTGVERASIRTVSLSVTPLYSDKILGSGPAKISAFRADNVIEISLYDTKTIGNVIDVAIAAGANEIQGVSFRIGDEFKQRSLALAAATEEAKTKAETIAQGLGITLGSVIEADETTGMAPLSPHLLRNAPSFSGVAFQESTPVEPGQIRLRASVTVRYEIGGRIAK